MTVIVRHELSPEEINCLLGCRTYKQYYGMRKRFEEDLCAFCHIDTNINKLLPGCNDHWMAWENPFVRDGVRLQLMIVPIRHVRFVHELTETEWIRFGNLMRWIGENYELPGGGMFARFGDMRWNAGTVPHLHWNFWVPDLTKEVRIPLAKEPEQLTKNQERAQIFASQYESGEIPEEA